MTKILTDKMVPYEGDELMLDYSTENMYSEHMVKLVAWHRHYTRFWKGSVLLCDWRWPDFFNANAPDGKGMSPEAEPKFLNAVTGGNLSFAQGTKIGRKIWNLDHAIWTLQGRHRDMVKFADYVYEVPSPNHYLPASTPLIPTPIPGPVAERGRYSSYLPDRHDTSDEASDRSSRGLRSATARIRF